MHDAAADAVLAASDPLGLPVNAYCTLLDTAGASLTLVGSDDEIEELLEAPAEIPNRVF